MTTLALFRVALIGLSDCGVGLAERLSTSGLMVRVTDPSTKHLMRARTLFQSLRAALVRTGLLPQDAADAAARQTQLLVNRTEALDRAQLVFDCIDGDHAQRQEHLAQLGREVSPEAIVVLVQPPADWTSLAKDFPHPQRLLALQLTEFPSMLRRCQVQPSPATAPAATLQITNLLLRCSMILDNDALASIPILSRLYGAVAREACEILAEQKLNPAQLDEVVRTLVGPMLTAIGPMEYIGEVGVDSALDNVLTGKLTPQAAAHLKSGGPDSQPLPLPEAVTGEDGLPECMRRLSRIQMNLT